ncbi:MAG: PD-(D/E)XK nuclease family protein [Alistipes sp.]|nr:PD-(D/E)XK nuclease family protein [Alistipes sp.]
MKSFIDEVALRLYEKYGNDMSSLTIIVPSKRARLFFSEALLNVASEPIWEPRFASIDEIMNLLSGGVRMADKLRLVAELFNVYSKYSKEKFDQFYHWGEMLVSDFDMIDKYMVDAEQLFTNIRDLKEIDSKIDYLTPEQIELINRFWNTLFGRDAVDSAAKSDFLEVWNALNAIYTEYRERLLAANLGYGGLIYREAVDRFERGETSLPDDTKYVCVGFNALTECERRLLKRLGEQGKVEFFWDYDNYYLERSSQEAGKFISKNLELGSESGISHDNLQNIKSINVLSTSSNVAQCQSVVNILEDILEKQGTLDKRTAIVLTDENLLMPLLYALPEKFKVEINKEGKEESRINVTMGYPLRNTLAYTFVERLLDLQKHASTTESGEPTFYHVDVEGLLSHPYVATSSISEFANLRTDITKHRLFYVPQSMLAKSSLLELIFSQPVGWEAHSKYILDVINAVSQEGSEGGECTFRVEYLAATYEALNKLHNVVSKCGVEVSVDIYRSLVRRHLQSERVPFIGEPLRGVQIMGILETRNLDFKNVILLSMTDNNFPGSHSTDKSFIPYALRYGFNIPTVEHHEAVYAYYFYRLIQRTENLYMLYSSASDDKSTGEPSRYIRQLEYETDFKINFTNVSVQVSLTGAKDITIEKSDEVYSKLLRFTAEYATEESTGEISPTAFSTYVQCPLRFYLNVVELLRAEDELEEEVDNLTFGNIFHDAAFRLYTKHLLKKDENPQVVLSSEEVRADVTRCVDEAIASVYFGLKDGAPMPKLGGELIIIRKMIIQYLRDNVLTYDKNHPDFRLDSAERDLRMEVPIEVNGEKLTVRFKGRADRIDKIDDNTKRIIDYKTGAMHLDFPSIDVLFHGPLDKRRSNIINTLLYSMMLTKMEPGIDVRPELYYVSVMNDEKYDPRLVDKSIDKKQSDQHLNRYSQYSEEFEGEVIATVKEIFDRSIPFSQCKGKDGKCDENGVCKYCDYRSLCCK